MKLVRATFCFNGAAAFRRAESIQAQEPLASPPSASMGPPPFGERNAYLCLLSKLGL